MTFFDAAFNRQFSTAQVTYIATTGDIMKGFYAIEKYRTQLADHRATISGSPSLRSGHSPAKQRTSWFAIPCVLKGKKTVNRIIISHSLWSVAGWTLQSVALLGGSNNVLGCVGHHQ